MGRVSPVSASSPTTAKLPAPVESDLAAPEQQPERDRQVEAAGVFFQVGRGKVDDDPVNRR